MKRGRYSRVKRLNNIHEYLIIHSNIIKKTRQTRSNTTEVHKISSIKQGDSVAGHYCQIKFFANTHNIRVHFISPDTRRMKDTQVERGTK